MTTQENGAYGDAAIHAQLGGLNAKVDIILNDQKQARLDRKEQYAKQEALGRRMDSWIASSWQSMSGSTSSSQP